LLLIGAALVLGGASLQADQPNDAVYASVGNHKFTEQEVDSAVLNSVSPSQLYDLRKRALDRMIDDYLIDQAAHAAGLTREQYLARELKPAKPTEAEARKFYDDNKSSIQAQIHNATFDQVKDRLIAALERQNEEQQRAALIQRLRQATPVNVALKPPRFTVNSDGHPWTGGADAPVTVVEFSDFQCPYCRAAESTVKAMRAKYGDRIKFVYMDFPLSFHPHAMDAARAAQCAAEQDKFWPYHDALFADQSKLAESDLKATAKRLGLDTGRFNTCFNQGQPDGRIKAEQQQGEALGVTGTPTFFINGREIVGAQPLDKFAEVIDDETSAANQRAARAN
jgi:protein-disulfide isomerase